MAALRLFAALGVVGSSLLPAAAHGALSKASGGSGYSGTLSTNRAVRQQQLICDPPEPILGSTSVLYEADKVSLDGFAYGPGYGPLNGLTGVVEVLVGTEPRLQTFASFFDTPQGTETGYVQVYYELDGGAGQITPGGVVLDEDPGPGQPGEGVDTHELLFLERQPGGPVTPQGVFPVTVATYTIYADPGTRPSGNRADFLIGLDDNGNRFELTAAQLQSATVTTPEPTSLAVVGMAATALLSRRRRSRA